MVRDNPSQGRRRFLKLAGAVGATGALAGCSGGDGSDGGDGGGDGDDGGGGSDGGGGTTTSTPTETEVPLSDLEPEEWRTEMLNRAQDELEGEKIIWTTAIRDEEVVQMWLDAWDETYPELEGRIQAIQGRATEIRTRLVREVNAGQNSIDVTTHQMDQAYGRIPFENLEGIPGFDALPDALKAREGRKGAYALLPICVTYNEELVEEPPTEYADLLDERFAGERITLDVNPSANFIAQPVEVGGEDFVRQLGEQPPRYTDSTFTLNQWVADGQAAVGFRGVGLHAILWANRGAPAAIAPSTEMTTWDTNGVNLPGDDRPHPNAARLFADYLMRQDNAELQAARPGQMAVDLETNGIAELAQEPYWAGPDESIYTIEDAVDFASSMDMNREEFQGHYQDLIGAPTI